MDPSAGHCRAAKFLFEAHRSRQQRTVQEHWGDGLNEGMCISRAIHGGWLGTSLVGAAGFDHCVESVVIGSIGMRLCGTIY